MLQLKTTLRWLIYGSVALGVILLIQLYLIVPSWLFYSILGGWLLYLAVAIAAAKGRESAYSAALVLSIITLLVTLPRPEHQNLVLGGVSVGSMTFLVGSALQIAVAVFAAAYLVAGRKLRPTEMRETL
ncbi:MAG TPA: hypothetical protein VFE98_11235 [Candidatus Bathyarchaeia archaeon]|nr:hypothetical protein [Candidatus Bathyarchaeia archaeon]